MAEDYIGSLVSVDCGSTLGVYEGCVIQVDSVMHTLTLKDPKRNGAVYPVAKVTLRAADIHDLKILKLRNEETVDDNGYKRSPKKTMLHHSKSFQNSKNNKIPNILFQRRRSQTPDPPNSNEIEYDENNFNKPVFNEYPGNGLTRKNRRSYSTNSNCVTSNYYMNERDCVLAEELDLSLMEDDFDFEANLALFDKLEVKNDLSSQPTVERLKKNIGHDEFVLHNPTDVYCKAKKAYKYRTELGSPVCSVTVDEKRQIFEQIVLLDSKAKDRFLHIYSMTIMECLYDSIGSKPLENLNIALVHFENDCESLDNMAFELSNDVRIHLESRSVRVHMCKDTKSLHFQKFDIALLFGCASSTVNFPTDMSPTILFIETDFWKSSALPSMYVKSLIFWQFPVSDCDIKSSSIYLCDVGLNLNTICEKFRLKRYQDPFGARFFTKVLKM